MFVSVILEPGGIDSARALVNILTLFGFKKVQRHCWESLDVKEDQLANLKKDIDRVTDYYDSVRLYQFPMDNGLFVITELKQKKWRKAQFKAPSAPSSPSSPQSKL